MNRCYHTSENARRNKYDSHNLLKELLVVCLCLASLSQVATVTAAAAFAPTILMPARRRGMRYTLQQFQVRLPRISTFQPRLAKNSDNDDDDDKGQTGMDEAFRQFEALDSLGKPSDGLTSSTVKMDAQSKASLSQAEEASLEQKAKVYQDMLQDSETQDEAALYSDMMKEMGGDATKTPPTSSSSSPKEPQITISEQQLAKGISSSDDDGKNLMSDAEREDFMNQAIQEALAEAQAMKNSPGGGNINKQQLSDSILDDEEIMKEIEEIFERGNEKLLASLEEIRQEQRELAKISAEQRSKVAMDKARSEDDDTKERLAAAEKSMAQQLSKVNQERAQVEKAVEDLKAAQEQMNADPLLSLSSNALKPAALAGVLLFSVRAVLDAIAMGGIDGEAHMTAALAQGAIALVCAAYLIFG